MALRAVILRALRYHVVDPASPSALPSPRHRPVILTGSVMPPRLQAQVPAQGTAATAQANAVGVSPWAAVVKSVSLTAAATITGVATNNRKFALVNKGQDGTGTTEIASITFANGTTATALDETAMTLSGTAANLKVAAGDVLAVVETINGSGLAHGGALATVQLAAA